jgi:uncharacterized protein involved in response to NO
MRHPHSFDSAPLGLPFLRLAFRPFYFGAALFGSAAMILWLGTLGGSVALTFATTPVHWHAHEMLFGFATAVIVGFLLTAGRAWTGLPTPRGAMLGALFALWASARIAGVVASYTAFFVLDVVFLPLAAFLFIELLVRGKSKRSLIIGTVLALLATANLLFHLGASGFIAIDPTRALYAALGLVVVLETIIGGRVIPAFTIGATPGLRLQRAPRRDACAVALGALGLACWTFDGPHRLSALLLGMAAVLHGIRLLSWAPWVAMRRPILWILHLSYAWIPLGFALLAASEAVWLPASLGIHALAVGATGGLIVGMMTRTARGHTGRPINASPIETTAYVLLLVAAAVRVFIPMAFPSVHAPALVVAGAMWATAFAIYLAIYTPWLMTTRLDGKDG